MNKISRMARIAWRTCAITAGFLFFKNSVLGIGIFFLGLLIAVGEAIYYVTYNRNGS